MASQQNSNSLGVDTMRKKQGQGKEGNPVVFPDLDKSPDHAHSCLPYKSSKQDWLRTAAVPYNNLPLPQPNNRPLTQCNNLPLPQYNNLPLT